MAQRTARAVQRLDHVAQHLQVDAHLLLVAPAAHEAAGLLVHGGIDHVGDVVPRAQRSLAGRRILQVQLQRGGARGQGDGAARHAHGAPAGQGGEVAQAGLAHDAGGAHDEYGVRHFFTMGHLDCDSGRKALSPGTVATSL